MKFLLLVLCCATGMCANDPFYASSVGGKILYDAQTQQYEGDFSVSISPNPYYIHKGFKK